MSGRNKERARKRKVSPLERNHEKRKFQANGAV